VDLITAFTGRIKNLGALGSGENVDLQRLMVRLKAAKQALEGKKVRMVLARQARFMKGGDGYREIPPEHKLHEELEKALSDEIAANSLLLSLQEKPRSVEELAEILELSYDRVIDHFRRLESKKIVTPEMLIAS
jgi:hypothetical protein